jgi:hypothetical protein
LHDQGGPRQAWRLLISLSTCTQIQNKTMRI